MSLSNSSATLPASTRRCSSTPFAMTLPSGLTLMNDPDEHIVLRGTRTGVAGPAHALLLAELARRLETNDAARSIQRTTSSSPRTPMHATPLR